MRNHWTIDNMGLELRVYYTLRKLLVTVVLRLDLQIEIYWGCVLQIFLLRQSAYQTKVTSCCGETPWGHITLCPVRTESSIHLSLWQSSKQQLESPKEVRKKPKFRFHNWLFKKSAPKQLLVRPRYLTFVMLLAPRVKNSVYVKLYMLCDSLLNNSPLTTFCTPQCIPNLLLFASCPS